MEDLLRAARLGLVRLATQPAFQLMEVFLKVLPPMHKKQFKQKVLRLEQTAQNHLENRLILQTFVGRTITLGVLLIRCFIPCDSGP